MLGHSRGYRWCSGQSVWYLASCPTGKGSIVPGRGSGPEQTSRSLDGDCGKLLIITNKEKRHTYIQFAGGRLHRNV
ncbi:hypothetical protein AMECASPLE_031066 [Ameca splendens]|uniref:Uncharacterized protein n=1 Tax=Ameca splendens TaxID=208324 RepID=A0ABV0XJ68_9TELE